MWGYPQTTGETIHEFVCDCRMIDSGISAKYSVQQYLPEHLFHFWKTINVPAADRKDIILMSTRTRTAPHQQQRGQTLSNGLPLHREIHGHLSPLSSYDASKRSRGQPLIVSTVSDQCAMSSESRHQRGKIWDRFIFVAR